MASLPLDLLRDAGVRLDAQVETNTASFTGAVTALASPGRNDTELASILADLQHLSPASVPIGQDVASLASVQEGKTTAASALDLGSSRRELPDGTAAVEALHDLRDIFIRLDKVQKDDAHSTIASGAGDALERLNAVVHALALQALLNEAHASRERSWAWRTVHDETQATLMYFAQTLPVRVLNAARQLASLIFLPLRHESDSHTLSSAATAPQPGNSTAEARRSINSTIALLKKQPAVFLFALFPWSITASQKLESKGLGVAPARSVAYRMGSAGIDLRSVIRPEDESIMGLSPYLTSMAQGTGFDAQVARSLSKATREMRRILLTPRSLATLPLRLVRDEARAKERALQDHIRQLAMAIGSAATGLQDIGSAALVASGNPFASTRGQAEQLEALVLPPENAAQTAEEGVSAPVAALNALENVLTTGLNIAGHSTAQTTAAQSLGLYNAAPLGLSTPAWWSRIWIKLFGYPLVGYTVYRFASNNRATIKSTLWGVWDTVKGLVVNWIYEPVSNFVCTLQRGTANHGLTAPLSLESDQASLARMVTDFAHDMGRHPSAASITSNLTNDQINEMTQRVKMGDLSPVMTVYEEQLKSPIKNLLTGSLVRPALIQMQKAKVDLELAMNGIDRLLASQQLVLGAVGLSPALGLLYIAQSWLRAQVSGVGQGSARSRAEATRLTAWRAVRGIEAALLSPQEDTEENTYIHGALLLDLTSLRAVAPALVDTSQTARHSKAARKALLHDLREDIRRLERASPSKPASQDSYKDARAEALVHLRHTWGSLLSL